MSTKGPGLFADFGKKAKDLLVKDYDSDQKFTIFTSTEAGIDIGSTLVKNGGLSSGDVSAKCKLRNTIIDVKVDTESNVSTTFTLTDIVPSTKAIASIKLPDYSTGKLEIQYLHGSMTFTTAVGLNQSPTVDFSAIIGTPSIAFGAEGRYLTSSGKFAKYDAGVNLIMPTSNASVLLADRGDSLRVSYLHHLDHLNGGAVGGEISRRFSTNENTLTVGCSYVVDSQTKVKAKLNNHGNLGAVLQQKLGGKSFLTLSGAFDTKALENMPKFGLALSLKP